MENSVEDGHFIIQDLPNLITPHMPCDQSKIVKVNYSRARYLDEYGSVYLRLKIELVNTTTGENWMLSTIAKTLPKYSVTHDIFKIRAIFKNQVGLYTTARNTIDVYLKGKGVKQGEDVMLRSFGGRINLNGSDDIDQNAVLVTTDPKCSFAGFKSVHRRTGFDFESTKAILLALAKFHAGTLALKTDKFKEFRSKVRPYLNECGSVLEGNNFEQIARIHMISALKDSGFANDIVDKAVRSFENKVSTEEADHWATFTHSNLWVKNILVKYDKKGQPLDVKLKGFQEAQYASALRDLLFFLFTSVQLVVLKQHLPDLISFYYDQFHQVLNKLEVSCDHFLRDSFNEELSRITSDGEFCKIVCALYPILGNDMHSDGSSLKDPLHITRLCFIVKEFIARDWL
ncbi:uncharacterized protein [Euwallacea fornicatus]|uniref:uncharacterized protein n=1 Tax=Euwallacea fornicatus TaxID=995702 RepID=UPI00338FC52E